MNKKSIVLTIIVLIIAVCGGIYSYNTYNNYQNITVGGVICEVPVSDVNTTNQNGNPTYDNAQNHVKIVVYDEIGEENNTTALSFDEEKTKAQTNAKPTTKANITYNLTPSGIYSYYTNNSGRNVLITTHDENTIIHILQTLHIQPLEEQQVNDTNQNNNSTADKDSKATPSSTAAKSSNSKSSSQSSESTALQKAKNGRAARYSEGNWEHGYGAGAADDPDITWVHNKKTGYAAYYDHKTGQHWEGYNIA